MQPDSWIQLLIRALPALVVFILGFVAAADAKTRARWGNLLYQIGSVRPDQREDPKIGSGVKWPFFVVALALLIWPINYYRVATRRLEIKSDIYSNPQPRTIYDNNAANNGVTNGVTSAVAPEDAANSVTDSAPAPATSTGQAPNIYGQPR